MIRILDYGMGNLRNVEKAFHKLGHEAQLCDSFGEAMCAEKLVLPGVGAFGACIENLRKSGLDQVVLSAIEAQTPVLGICVGMQMLFERSEEKGDWQGLGVFKGSVIEFPKRVQDQPLKVPQIGWNSLQINPSEMFAGLESGAYVYFVHSYYAVPEDPQIISSQAEHGIQFCAAVERGNLWATQFHPEKSGAAGLQVLDNFGKL